MKKRLTFLVAAMLLALCSFADSYVARDNADWGDWAISQNGTLHINFMPNKDGTWKVASMPDYGNGGAPWHGYADRITSVEVHGFPDYIGKHWFQDLDKVTKFDIQHKHLWGIGTGAFENFGTPDMQLVFPNVTKVYQWGLTKTNVSVIALPKVEEVQEYGISYNQNLTALVFGPKLRLLKRACMAYNPRLCLGNLSTEPSVFFQSYTPPEFKTGYEKSTWQKIKDWFNDIFTTGEETFSAIKGAVAEISPVLGLVDSTLGTNLESTTHNCIEQLHTFEKDAVGELQQFSDKYHLQEWANLGVKVIDHFEINNSRSNDDADWVPPFGELQEGTPLIAVPIGNKATFSTYYNKNQDHAELGYFCRNQVETEKPEYYTGTETGKRCYSQGKFIEAEPFYSDYDPDNEYNYRYIGWYALSDNNLIISFIDNKNVTSKYQWLKETLESNSSIAPGSLNVIFSRSTSVIPMGAFNKCTKIGSVWTFCPNVVVEEAAFEGCPNLKDVSIQGEDAVIGHLAFARCPKLEEVEFGGKKIDGNAFYQSSFSGLKMPNVESIGEFAFSEAELRQPGQNDTVLVEFPKLKSLILQAFKDFKVTAPNAKAIKLSLPVLDTINHAMFLNTNFTHVNIPNVKMIYPTAFFDCKDLQEVRVNNLRTLSKNSFGVTEATGKFKAWYSNKEAPDTDNGNPFGNRNLSSAYLHVPLNKEHTYTKKEWWQAFQRVTDGVDFPLTGNGWSLAEDGVLTVSGTSGVTGYEQYASYIHTVEVVGNAVPAALLKNMKVDKVVMKAVKTIGGRAFEGALVKEFVLPETLEEIAYSAFQNMQAGSQVISRLPNSVKIIGQDAFSGTKIANLELGENLEEIGNHAFQNCSMQSLKLKSKINKIREEAFINNPLNSVEIAGETPPALEKNVFDKNSNVYLKMPEAAWLTYVSSDWKNYFKFKNDSHGEVLHSGVYAYPSTRYAHFADGVLIVSGSGGGKIELAEDDDYVNGWKKDVKEVIMMGSVSLYSSFSTADPPFMNMQNLEKVTLTEDITSIPTKSFANCPKLKTINLDKVEKIGDSAFEGCESLEGISFASVNDGIGSSAFRGCKSLKEVYLPISVSVGSNAFADCTSLERFKAKTILGPNQDNNLFGQAMPVSAGAFSNCSKLVEFQMEPAYFDHGCFTGCSSLKKLTFGNAIGLVNNIGFFGDIFSGTGLEADDAEGIYISRPTPPDFGKPWASDAEQVVYGWGSLNPSKIKVHVPKAWIETYRNWKYWKETNLMEDEEYANFEGLPVGGIYDKNGTWTLDADGKLTIRYEGDMSQGDARPDIGMIYAPYIKSLVYTDGAKVIGGPLGSNNLSTFLITTLFLNITHLDNFTTIVMGSDVENLTLMAFQYVPTKQLKDIFIAAPVAPNCDYEETFVGVDFSYPAAEYGPLSIYDEPSRAEQFGRIRCHVSSAPGVLESYQNTDFWKELNLIDDYEDFDDIADGDHALDIPEYNVVFKDFDGKILSEQTVLRYESAVAPEEPTREGFRFTGWSVEFECVLNDLEIEAQYVELDGLENVTVKGKDGRYLINGQLYIITSDGAVYNAAGMRVK